MVFGPSFQQCFWNVLMLPSNRHTPAACYSFPTDEPMLLTAKILRAFPHMLNATRLIITAFVSLSFLFIYFFLIIKKTPSLILICYSCEFGIKTEFEHELKKRAISIENSLLWENWTVKSSGFDILKFFKNNSLQLKLFLVECTSATFAKL